MSVTVVPYRVAGDAEEGPEGRRERAVYLVHGLEGDPSRYFWEALKQSQIPRYGAPHPSEPGLFASRRRVRVGQTGDRHDVRVEITYAPQSALMQGATRPVGSVRRQMRSELVTEETTRDVNGNQMRTRYITRFSISLSGSSITISDVVHRVSVQRPSISVVTNRIERNFPLELGIAASGSTNAGRFRNRGQDQWLLNIEAEDLENGTYDVAYTATLFKSGWQATIIHSENGIVPIGVQPGNGEEVKQVYPRSNFSLVPL